MASFQHEPHAQHEHHRWQLNLHLHHVHNAMINANMQHAMINGKLLTTCMNSAFRWNWVEGHPKSHETFHKIKKCSINTVCIY